MTIDYEKLVGCCSSCERQGFKIVENGYCHTDLYDNGICMDCYDVLIKINLAKRFSASNLSKPMPLCMDIYG